MNWYDYYRHLDFKKYYKIINLIKNLIGAKIPLIIEL